MFTFMQHYWGPFRDSRCLWRLQKCPGELNEVLKAIIKVGKTTDFWQDTEWATCRKIPPDLLTYTTASSDMRVQAHVRRWWSDGTGMMNSTPTHDNKDWIISSSSVWIQWQLSGMWSSCACSPRQPQRLNQVYQNVWREKKNPRIRFRFWRKNDDK